MSPPLSVQSRDSSKLQTAASAVLREPHHPHHNRQQNLRSGREENRPNHRGSSPSQGSGQHGGPPLKPDPDLSSLFYPDASLSLRASAEEGPPRRRRRRSAPPTASEPSQEEAGAAEEVAVTAGELFSSVPAEWRTVRRRQYRWRSEPGWRSWSWSCQRVRN